MMTLRTDLAENTESCTRQFQHGKKFPFQHGKKLKSNPHALLTPATQPGRCPFNIRHSLQAGGTRTQPDVQIGPLVYLFFPFSFPTKPTGQQAALGECTGRGNRHCRRGPAAPVSETPAAAKHVELVPCFCTRVAARRCRRCSTRPGPAPGEPMLRRLGGRWNLYRCLWPLPAIRVLGQDWYQDAPPHTPIPRVS